MGLLDILRLAFDVAVLGAIAIGTLFLKNYLPSYLGEKGKNLATKEDIELITDKIEAVKALHAQDLELVRAALASRSHVYQVRYEREYDILRELSEKVIEL